MSKVTPALVKELRDRTGLGMMECKKALTEAGADIDLAIENLRKSSGLKAAKKAGRTAAEGKILVVIQPGVAVAVEVNSETDFAAGDANFIGFAGKVDEKAAATRETDVAKLMAGELEDAREPLVQNIGENNTVGRPSVGEAEALGAYVHSNGKVVCIVVLKGGD